VPRRAVRSEPPEDLAAEQWNALSRWAAQKEPWAIPRLETLVANCLDHHRARGNRAGIVNWVAACQLWVRNEREWRGGSNGIAGKAPARGNQRGDVSGAARDFARSLGLFGGDD
jgi:hypothetical protein